MKLLVLGGSGQLGGAFDPAHWAAHEASPMAGHDVVRVTRREVDVTDADAVRRAVTSHAPDAIVNCTAYTDVDGAETDARTALAVNALALRTLAEVAGDAGAALVHYSTDFVFDGETTRPYTEEDRARPVSVYGMSKLLGEWFAADAPRAYVLRVESLFGGPQARSSVDRIAQALREGREAPVFVDRTVSPSFVDDVVTATMGLLTRNAAPGLYHCVNTGHATWAEVGEAIASLLGVSRDLLRPMSVRDVEMRARRPVYCALSNARLAAALGAPLPTWEDGIGRYLKTRRSGGGET
jgi:dTDP-4-dehydrorhamnose reductase